MSVFTLVFTECLYGAKKPEFEPKISEMSELVDSRGEESMKTVMVRKDKPRQKYVLLVLYLSR
jgi:50S ribosomal subunit-associated GTPase HflX